MAMNCLCDSTRETRFTMTASHQPAARHRSNPAALPHLPQMEGLAGRRQGECLHGRTAQLDGVVQASYTSDGRMRLSHNRVLFRRPFQRLFRAHQLPVG